MSVSNIHHGEISKTAHKYSRARFMKATLATKFQYGLNPLRNANYLTKTAAVGCKNRIGFTVVGQRTAIEFINCANLVQDLYKYRWQEYEAPKIRGCSDLEWLSYVKYELKISNGCTKEIIKNQVAVICNDELIGGENELKEYIEDVHKRSEPISFEKKSINQTFINANRRPCAYLHIAIDGEPIGSMTFMLYSEIVPETCENFLRLCQAETGGYKGTPVHRIVKDAWIQCGGFHLKSRHIGCENFQVPHDRRGVLGMANAGRDEDCSTQFYILLQPSNWMQYKFVAFGQLIDGDDTLSKIEAVETYYESPKVDITICDAGALNVEKEGDVNATTDSTVSSSLEYHFEKYLRGEDSTASTYHLKGLEEEREEVSCEISVDQVSIEHHSSPGPLLHNKSKNVHATQRFRRKKDDYICYPLKKKDSNFPINYEKPPTTSEIKPLLQIQGNPV